MSTYGITPEDFDRMLEEQGGVCKLCGSPDPGSRWGVFAVDHCHKTSRVRGLLCVTCNRQRIGSFNDDIELLERALAYMKGTL